MTEPETKLGKTRSLSPIIVFGPTSLTVIRLVLGLAFLFIPSHWRTPVVLVAVLTEFLDGQLARIFRVTSVLGRVLDPIADKTFVVAVLFTLLAEGTVTPGQLCLVMARDIVVIVGASCVAVRRGLSAVRQMPPSLLGKVATAAQLIFILALNVTAVGRRALFVTSAILSIAAALDYLRRYRSWWTD